MRILELLSLLLCNMCYIFFRKELQFDNSRVLKWREETRTNPRKFDSFAIHIANCTLHRTVFIYIYAFTVVLAVKYVYWLKYRWLFETIMQPPSDIHKKRLDLVSIKDNIFFTLNNFTVLSYNTPFIDLGTRTDGELIFWNKCQ